MNQASQNYWQAFWQNETPPQEVSAWQFGAEPDTLASLVTSGIKTATCSGHLFYELENEPLPQVGNYNIILNSKDQPVAITRITEVSITPMNQVTEDFARAEGEGDLSYAYWWKVHKDFFEKELAAIHREFQEDMLLVCERFECIHVHTTG